jgi:hypothetical protein
MYLNYSEKKLQIGLQSFFKINLNLPAREIYNLSCNNRRLSTRRIRQYGVWAATVQYLICLFMYYPHNFKFTSLNNPQCLQRDCTARFYVLFVF